LLKNELTFFLSITAIIILSLVPASRKCVYSTVFVTC